MAGTVTDAIVFAYTEGLTGRLCNSINPTKK
jgi:hypothetical protein